MDGATVLGAVLLLSFICLLASLPSARRIGTMDPLEALRGE